MGYEADYSLSIDCPRAESDKIIKRLRDNNEEAWFALTEDGRPRECTKWYDNEEIIKGLSEAYPTLLFIFEEENVDEFGHQRKYFMNGKMQKTQAHLRFEEFDEDKLI